MPPKVRIQKEDIISAALSLVRENGEQALNARTIAAALHCSTQPLFSNFASMDELRAEVVKAADGLFQKFLEEEIDRADYPPYKAGGMAYIQFAKRERELFRLLFMRDRSAEQAPEASASWAFMNQLVQNVTGFSASTAELFHLEMWAFVHGIAVMLATGYLDLAPELISGMLTDAYQGLKHRYEKEH